MAIAGGPPDEPGSGGRPLDRGISDAAVTVYRKKRDSVLSDFIGRSQPFQKFDTYNDVKIIDKIRITTNYTELDTLKESLLKVTDNVTANYTQIRMSDQNLRRIFAAIESRLNELTHSTSGSNAMAAGTHVSDSLPDADGGEGGGAVGAPEGHSGPERVTEGDVPDVHGDALAGYKALKKEIVDSSVRRDSTENTITKIREQDSLPTLDQWRERFIKIYLGLYETDLENGKVGDIIRAIDARIDQLDKARRADTLDDRAPY